MRFGLLTFPADLSGMLEAAASSEQLGYDALYTGDPFLRSLRAGLAVLRRLGHVGCLGAADDIDTPRPVGRESVMA